MDTVITLSSEIANFYHRQHSVKPHAQIQQLPLNPLPALPAPIVAVAQPVAAPVVLPNVLRERLALGR